MFKKYVICKIKGFNTIIKSIKTYIFYFYILSLYWLHWNIVLIWINITSALSLKWFVNFLVDLFMSLGVGCSARPCFSVFSPLSCLRSAAQWRCSSPADWAPPPPSKATWYRRRVVQTRQQTRRSHPPRLDRKISISSLRRLSAPGQKIRVQQSGSVRRSWLVADFIWIFFFLREKNPPRNQTGRAELTS